MASIRDRIVEIAYELRDRFTGRLSKITGGIRDVENASTKSARSIEAGNIRAADSYDGVIGAVGRTKIAILSIVAAAGAAVSAVGRWTQAAAAQERAETKLATTLRNLTGASEEQIQALEDQAAALQQLTGFGDEQTISAQAMLGTFQLTADEIAVLTPRLLDMAESARKLGKAEVDLESISIALGKAFTSGIGSLSRYGVAMTDAQKEAFKLADQSEKVAILAEVLDSNFEGLAVAVGSTYEGAVRKADAAAGDLQETLGQQFTQNADWIKLNEQVAKSWDDLAEGVKGSSENIAVIVSGLAKSIAVASHVIRSTWNGLSSLFRVTAAAVVSSLGSIADALGVLTFGDVSRRFHQFAQDMRGTSNEILKGIQSDWEDIADSTRTLSDAFADVEIQARKTETTIGDIGSTASDAASDTRDLAAETKDLTSELRNAEKVAAQEVQQFNKVSQQADEVRQKFAELTAEIAGTAAKAEGFTFTDVVQAMTAAREALAAGDFSGAVEGAERAGEMLRDMKERGEESDGVLTALAMKLQDIVGQATQGQQQAELVDAEKALNDVDTLRAKIQDISEGPVQLELDVDTTVLDGLRNQRPVVIPVQYTEVAPLVPPTVTQPVDVPIDADTSEAADKITRDLAGQRIEIELDPQTRAVVEAISGIGDQFAALSVNLTEAIGGDPLQKTVELDVDQTALDALERVPIVIPVHFAVPDLPVSSTPQPVTVPVRYEVPQTIPAPGETEEGPAAIPPVVVPVEYDTSQARELENINPQPVIVPVQFEVIDGVPSFGGAGSGLDSTVEDFLNEADKRGVRL